MTVDQTLQQVFQLVLPEAVLIATAALLFLLATTKLISRPIAGLISLVGIAVACFLHSSFPPPSGLIETVSPIMPSGLGNFVRLTALATGGLLVLLCWNECDEKHVPEYLACLLCATAGFSLVGSANDLIVLFLALELVSIPTYIMLYLPMNHDEKGQESAVKYFLLSVVSSALTLFGFSYLYGVTGTTNLGAIVQLLPRFVAGDLATPALISAIMVLAGMGFRVTAFPFHFYAPDVYQGGPSGTVAFLAFVPKVAGFAAFIKLYGYIGEAGPVAPAFVKNVMMLLWFLAAVTMTAGNILALLQNNLKRMLAYSGVANAGYMLVGLAVVPTQAYRASNETVIASGGEAILFYLIAYGATTIGVFAILGYLHTKDRPVETVDDVAGLKESHPACAFLLGIFLFSLIGLPLTAGFLGKLFIFLGAMAAPAAAPMQELFRVLAIIMAVNAAVAAYYYLRVVMAMYLRPSISGPKPAGNKFQLITATICATITIALGLYPTPLLRLCRDAFPFM